MKKSAYLQIVGCLFAANRKDLAEAVMISKGGLYDSFESWVGRQMFIHPQTRNRVAFKSLPGSMQQMIHKRWEKANEQGIRQHIEKTAKRKEGML